MSIHNSESKTQAGDHRTQWNVTTSEDGGMDTCDAFGTQPGNHHTQQNAMTSENGGMDTCDAFGTQPGDHCTQQNAMTRVKQWLN